MYRYVWQFISTLVYENRLVYMITVHSWLTRTLSTFYAVLCQDIFSVGMEQIAIASAVAFCSGWIARELLARTPAPIEPQACTCNCVWQGKAAEVTWNPPISLLLLVGLLGLGLIFSQTALALKVSYRDEGTGEDRTLSLAVKGKSKGVFGAKGLQLRG